jgi:transposase InsO family protein
MSALPSLKLASSIDLTQCVALVEAAKLLGRTIDHLSRVCREELEVRGLAVLSAEGGGQPKWFIHRSYDPRLADPGFDFQEPDLAGYTLKQQDGARRRRLCVKAFRESRMHARGTVKDWLPKLIDDLQTRYQMRISRAQLFDWDAKYRRPADLVKLIDTRGGDRKSSGDPAAWAAFRDLYLHQNRPSLRHCFEAVADLAKENGWSWCALRACHGQLNDRIPPEVQLYHRQPAKWRHHLSPYIKQDPESWGAGELWIGDHKQLDVVCRWGDSIIRPWLTSWMDWRTRKVTGWVLSDNPNSTTILAALRHGLLQPDNFGGPSDVAIDRGRDYGAWLFHGSTKKERYARIQPDDRDEGSLEGIFAPLKIRAHFSIPYGPNGKAMLERFHCVLESFCKAFDTYTGDKPETKPERLAGVLATPHRVPAFKQIDERFGAFIEGYNANADHSRNDLAEDGQTISPNEAMARWCETRRIMADPKSLDLLLMHWHRPLTVGRNGISINVCGEILHYGHFMPELMPFKAPFKQDRKLINVAFDPHNLATIKVYHQHFRWICDAPMNELGGMHGDAISRNTVAELSRRKANYVRSLKHAHKHSLTSILTTEEQLAEISGV